MKHADQPIKEMWSADAGEVFVSFCVRQMKLDCCRTRLVFLARTQRCERTWLGQALCAL